MLKFGPIFGLASLVFMLLIFGACSSYGHQRFRSAFTPPSKSPLYSLAFVELDDRGQFWDKENDPASQVQSALQLVRDTAAKGNTVVVVFVHGWHHNASADDDNVACFEATLDKLNTILNTGVPLQARESIGSPEINLVGLYVGWRGKSLPMPADYGTFFGRKAAAHRIGEGDLRRLFLGLDEIYKQGRKATDRFLGWVTIGHSFGGHAVFSAMSQPLEQQIFSRKAGEAVTGLGDLVVLVNPAVEAAAFRHISEASEHGKFPSRQRPLVFVVSSTGDWAVRKAFPLGRKLSFFGRPKMRPEQREMETQGLGVYQDQITHCLQWIGPAQPQGSTEPDPLEIAFPSGASGKPCTWQDTLNQPAATGANDSLRATDYKLKQDSPILSWDFSGDTILAGVRLQRIKGSAHSPTIIATTNNALIKGHNGIFSRRFVDFLTLFVGYIEGSYVLEHAASRVGRKEQDPCD